MGAMVTRVDPKTGLDRDYYKADDGKLYNDYSAAVAANPTPSNPVDQAVNYGTNLVGRAYKGVDGALGNLLTEPSVRKATSFARDFAIEAAPGNQRTRLDNSLISAEGATKKGAQLLGGDLGGTAVQTNTQRQVGRIRERVAETGGREILRRAGTEIMRRAPAWLTRTKAAASTLNPVAVKGVALWSAVDAADAITEVATGRGFVDRMQDNADPNRKPNRMLKRRRHY